MKSAAFIPLFTFILCSAQMLGQDLPYASFFSGNRDDKAVQPEEGIVMMGGRSEHDEAMKWFLQKANGGDILVLRASGSDGYNNYLFEQLGVQVNSVESLVIKSPEAADHPYVLQKIRNAEAIWMAGGDQWNYINIWGRSKMKAALQEHIEVKKGVIGGASAGMAVLGQFSFSAENGSIRSEEALADPFHPRLTITQNFLDIPFLSKTITDTHYAERNRQGRHVVFMSRIAQKTRSKVYGIACDEYVAICIGEDGIAHVYGYAPERTHAAYFIRSEAPPEVLEAEKALTWSANQKALSVYRIIGDPKGKSTFNLNNWSDGSGGVWLNWYIENGTWFEVSRSN